MNVVKNMLWGNIGNVTTSILQFVSRTVFIYTLGATYLGVNGLFSNILGLLSFTELGIGSAMNYSLYKPIAENDNEKIKSLMQLYRRAYRLIAVVIAVLGLLLLPFLNTVVSSEAHFEYLKLYYLIFLFNTVSTYFVTYKYAYITAMQKEYVLSNFNTIFQVSMTILQIIVLICTQNFLAYLLMQSGWGLIQKIVTALYIDKKYPILTEKNIQKLSEQDKKAIFSNVKALIVHKVGDVAVHQTDNLLISVFVNTTAVGLVSNYTTLQTMITKFSNTFVNSFVAGFGNLIAKDSLEKQRKAFSLYNFFASWIFGFVAVCSITLADPFVELWIGKEMVLDKATVVLFFYSYYLSGQTLAIYNFKVAAGIFNDDKFIAYIQAAVNLVASIIFVKMFGTPGIYMGTILQRMVVVIFRPYIVYKKHLKTGLSNYYYCFFKDAVVVGLVCWLLDIVKNNIYLVQGWAGFIVLCVLTVIICNLIFAICNIKRMRDNDVYLYIKKAILKLKERLKK